eukprot:1114403-Rhodomonas_salina.1
MTDELMVAHHHYPQNPPVVLAGAALAQAQAEVDAVRRKAQITIHTALVQTCAKEFFAQCTAIKSTFPNCGTMLWRAIKFANNPDGEAQ